MATIGKTIIIPGADFSGCKVGNVSVITPTTPNYVLNVTSVSASTGELASITSCEQTRFWYSVAIQSGATYKITISLREWQLPTISKDYVAIRFVDSNTVRTGEDAVLVKYPGQTGVTDTITDTSISTYSVTRTVTASGDHGYVYLNINWNNGETGPVFDLSIEKL